MGSGKLHASTLLAEDATSLYVGCINSGVRHHLYHIWSCGDCPVAIASTKIGLLDQSSPSSHKNGNFNENVAEVPVLLKAGIDSD